MYAPATNAEADLLFRVVETILRLVFDASTNHSRDVSIELALHTPKTHASTGSHARIVDTLIHSLIGTQARVADSWMVYVVLGSHRLG